MAKSQVNFEGPQSFEAWKVYAEQRGCTVENGGGPFYVSTNNCRDLCGSFFDSTVDLDEQVCEPKGWHNQMDIVAA